MKNKSEFEKFDASLQSSFTHVGCYGWDNPVDYHFQAVCLLSIGIAFKHRVFLHIVSVLVSLAQALWIMGHSFFFLIVDRPQLRAIPVHSASG